jgi:molybdenum cofactor biosynthesis protein B
MNPTSGAHAHGADARDFVPVGVAVLTVSDTRTLEDDDSGALLEARVREAGHSLHDRKIVADDGASIREQVLAWAEREEVQVILVTGGTGVTRRDVTPDTLEPLYEKALPGYGELFRWLSYREIGTSTIQSRASAWVVGRTIVFTLPGSTKACRLGIDEIILPQLDARTKPCSFVSLFDRM